MAISPEGMVWFMKMHLKNAHNNEIKTACSAFRKSFVLHSVASDAFRNELVTCWAYLSMLSKSTDGSVNAILEYSSDNIKPLLDMEQPVTEENRETLQRYIISISIESQELYFNVIGFLIQNECKTQITDCYNIQQLVFDDTDESREIIKRMKRIFYVYAEKCTYERTGDVYIHYLLRSKLSAWRNAILNETNTPYEMITDEFGQTANAIVRPFIEQSPGTKIASIEWNDCTAIDSFHFIVGLLRELIDGYDGKILVNSEIAKEISHNMPEFFVCSSDFDLGVGTTYGFKTKTQLFLAPAKEPLLGTLFTYISTCVEIGKTPLSELFVAIKTPGLLSASSAFNSFL